MAIVKTKLETVKLRDYTDDSKHILKELGVDDEHDKNDEEDEEDDVETAV